MYFEKIIFFLSIIFLNTFIILKIQKLSKIINIFDKPDNILKKHKSKVALIGGVILAFNLILILFLNLYLDIELFMIDFSLKQSISIFFFLITFFLLGLFDDRFAIKPERKIILSILFSIIVLSLNKNLLVSDLNFSFYKNRLYLNDFSYLFTLFCIIILINAINFYDGINGQSIIFFIICFSYLAYSSSAFIFYLLIIFILTFILFLNFSGKLFMGDSGIYLTGSILITSLVYEYNELKSIQYADTIFLLLLIPGFDLVRLSITRIFNGKNAFYGDRNHIHHLLLRKFSLLKTNIILSLLSSIPILLFTFVKLNFFIVLVVITITYVWLIFTLKK